MTDNKKLGLGSCSCGTADAGPLTVTMGGWRTARVEQVASYSPVIAYARAKNLPFAPFPINIRNTFTDPNVNSLSPVSFEGSNERLSQTSICDSIEFLVTAPNLNSGNSLKYVNDWFFQRQTGIESNMLVSGTPRYAVAPFFTPISTLLSNLGEAWPLGWVVEYTQSVTMQFIATIPLPSLPVNVCVTFRFWQPYSDLEIAGMDNLSALRGLQAMGYCQGWQYQNGILLSPNPNGTLGVPASGV